jgi:hypothetical protein
MDYLHLLEICIMIYFILGGHTHVMNSNSKLISMQMLRSHRQRCLQAEKLLGTSTGAQVTLGHHTSTEPPLMFTLHIREAMYMYPGLIIVVKAVRFLLDDQQLADAADEGLLEGGIHFSMVELASQMIPVHNTAPQVYNIIVGRCGILHGMLCSTEL